MQLYATVKSERATKGQGGNHYIEIAVTDARKNVLDTLTYIPFPNGDTLTQHGPICMIQKSHGGGYIVPCTEVEEELKKRKGEKKKGEDRS